jgi:hypothetical protein
MKKFKQYISEAKTEGAAMETIIVSAWNNKPIPPTTKIHPNAGKNIVNFLKSQGVTGQNAYKLENKGVDVTEEWSKFWHPNKVPPATKTPKTDIIIGNYTISLKTGPAQLMSGGKNEAKATFYAAALKTPSIQSDDLAKKIYAKMDALSGAALTKSGTVEQALKQGQDLFLKKANVINHEVQIMMREIFNTNEEFKRNFVYEAMSGEVKFGPTPAKATWLLSTDMKGENNKLVKTKDKTYIKKLSDVTSVECRFKSASQKITVDKVEQKTGKYTYFSVIGLTTKKLKEEFESYDGMFLTEGMITDVLSKVKNYLKDLLVKVLEWLKGGIQRIIDFFELEPEISFNNNIDFTRL